MGHLAGRGELERIHPGAAYQVFHPLERKRIDLAGVGARHGPGVGGVGPDECIAASATDQHADVAKAAGQATVDAWGGVVRQVDGHRDAAIARVIQAVACAARAVDGAGDAAVVLELEKVVGTPANQVLHIRESSPG